MLEGSGEKREREREMERQGWNKNGLRLMEDKNGSPKQRKGSSNRVEEITREEREKRERGGMLKEERWVQKMRTQTLDKGGKKRDWRRESSYGVNEMGGQRVERRD